MTRTLLTFLSYFFCIFVSTTSIDAQIYINEFLASNGTGITDEAGDFEDWIEIYNAGNTDVDLAGYYISDDILEPLLWQIPTGGDPILTTVPAGEYLILWADKDTEDGPHHVDIKLGAGGEDIILTNPDGVTVVDQITFGAQTEDISNGRETDGAANFVFFPTPSPSAENVPGGAPTYTVTLEISLANGLDDAEQEPNGNVILNSQDIEMVVEAGSPAANTAGLRFTDIGLPADAVINAAFLQFFAEEVQVGPANLTIRGEDAGNSAPFQSINNNITARSTTTASTNWIPAPWPTIGATGPAQQTTDISSLVAEIVAHPSWESGNAMSFIFSGSGTRTTYAYEQNPARAAKLIIEAEIPLSTVPIPTVYINEVAANSSSYLDESGTKEDWVEIYNPNAQDVDLSGLYLTDKFSDLDKWQIPSGIIVPAGGYLVFFTDNDDEEGPLHTNFSLKAGGEQVALSQLLADGLTVIDSLSYEDMPFMTTYGRETDGNNTLILFGASTPEVSNNGADLYLPAPSFSVVSGSYANSQTVTISSAVTGSNIFYTTDGSYPDNNSNFYNGPVTVSETSSIRAIARKNGHANSQPSDVTYLINENKNLPILYITTDPDNFFDDEIGIYVDGTNGVQAYCASEPVNWARDWERPINLKMFLPDGELAFDVDAGVEINGACSRNRAMKSLGINLRDKEFGDEAIEYPLFTERDHQNYQRLKLRNSGQDFIRLGFRDMVNQNMITGKLDIDLQAGRPSLLYINGEFWGIHNIREKFAGEYFEAIYGVNENDLDIIKSPGLPYSDLKKGGEEIYDALYDVVDGSDMTNDADWNYFESQVDVNEMLNYWITMTYMNNYDWPANNLTVWRERKEGAKWRYGMADTDGSTQNELLSTGAEPSFNKFELINQPNITNWPNHSNSTLFLRKALDRQAFRDEFIQRSCSVVELVYNETRVNSFIDETVGLFQPNIQQHLDRWSYDNVLGGSLFNWNRWIDLYRDFYQQRPTFWRAHLNDFYNLNGYYDLTVSFDTDSGGDVVVNTNEMEIPYNYVGTYFKDIPLRLKAVAQPGYVFQFWLETGDTNPEIDFVGNTNTTLTPIFQLLDCTQIAPGTACDDGDDCTTDDVYDNDCNCVGTFSDEDTDGVCDAEDQCPGFDDNLDLNGNGIPDDCEGCIDADGDLVCFEDDCDDNNPDVPATPGTVCNDGNSQTTNDVILADGCTCRGAVIPPPGEYCEAEGDAPWLEWIANIEFNDLNNNSSKSKYSDFTGLSATLSPGENYLIALTTGFSWEVFDEYYRVWIDYNQNNVFDEPEEIAYSGILTGSPNGTSFADLLGSIDVPANAPAGTTRMRVSMQRGAYAAPCGNFPRGEVEDYSIVIAESGPSITLDNCPEDIVEFAPIGETSAQVTWTPPTAFTTCDPNTVSLVQTTGPPNGSFFNFGGPTNITYRATDDCGNIEFCTFRVFVMATNNGTVTIDCPSDLVISALPGETGANISWNDATGVSSCPNDGLFVAQSGGQASGSFFPIGFYQILYRATDDCGNQAFCSFDITVLPGGPPGEYCESEGEFPWHDWMANVQLNNLNNTSGKSKYSDFTNISTNLNPGATYTFSGTTNFSYYTFDEYWKVWIDYNQDGIFSEPSEVAFAGVLNAPPNGTLSADISGSINIPGNAPFGLTRMRVAMKRGAEPSPCEIFGFGEVEDYQVNIVSPQSLTRASSKVKIFPNPASSLLNVVLEKNTPLQQMEIFDITGKKIQTVVGGNGKHAFKFDVTNWSKGVYIFHIRLTKGKSISKRIYVNSRF